MLATAGAPSVDGAVDLPARSMSGRYQRVLVVVADRADLRAAVLPHAVRTPTVAVWVASLAAAPGFVARPEWPPMKAFRAQPVGDGYLVVARFEQPVRAANVVRELGRLSVWPAPEGAGGLVVDDGSGPDVPIEERDVPPDVVLAPTGPLAEHHVTGRAPVVVGVGRHRPVRRAGVQPDRLRGGRRRPGRRPRTLCVSAATVGGAGPVAALGRAA